jgi:hypothetical protein
VHGGLSSRRSHDRPPGFNSEFFGLLLLSVLLRQLQACLRGCHLRAIGLQELPMARKIVRPVTGEAAPALGAQRTLKGSDDMCPARGRDISASSRGQSGSSFAISARQRASSASETSWMAIRLWRSRLRRQCFDQSEAGAVCSWLIGVWRMRCSGSRSGKDHMRTGSGDEVAQHRDRHGRERKPSYPRRSPLR